MFFRLTAESGSQNRWCARGGERDGKRRFTPRSYSLHKRACVEKCKNRERGIPGQPFPRICRSMSALEKNLSSPRRLCSCAEIYTCIGNWIPERKRDGQKRQEKTRVANRKEERRETRSPALLLLGGPLLFGELVDRRRIRHLIEQLPHLLRLDAAAHVVCQCPHRLHDAEALVDRLLGDDGN